MKLKALLHNMAYRYKAYYRAVGTGGRARGDRTLINWQISYLNLFQLGGGRIMPTTLLIPPDFQIYLRLFKIYNLNVHLH